MRGPLSVCGRQGIRRVVLFVVEQRKSCADVTASDEQEKCKRESHVQEIRIVVLKSSLVYISVQVMLSQHTKRLRCAAPATKLLCSALLLLGLATSCATTKPYQREHLANPVMNPDGDGDQEALRAHMLGTREGTVGGFGAGGGGCGCN